MPVLKDFSTFRVNAMRAKNVVPYDGLLLALDPGETTGWSLWKSTKDEVELLECGQVKTWDLPDAIESFDRLINKLLFTHNSGGWNIRVVFELYSVYEWKSQDHSWSEVPTIQVIGCLRTLLIKNEVPYSSQTAQIAKNFMTDNKLKSWGLWQEGQRHARDSIRHGAYYLCFGGIK